MTRTSTARREAGFTLIELLVGLAILGLTASLLLGGIVTASALTRQTRQSEVAATQVAAAQAILRARIEGMIPVRRLDRPDPLFDVRGSDHGFEFFAPAPLASGGDTVQRYRLLLTAPGDLALYRISELNDVVEVHAPSVVGWTGSALLGGVRSLAIDYYGPTSADRQPKWRSFWEDQSRAPRLVRIRVAFAEGDKRRWPTLILRPKSTIDLACDPETPAKRCASPA